MQRECQNEYASEREKTEKNLIFLHFCMHCETNRVRGSQSKSTKEEGKKKQVNNFSIYCTLFTLGRLNKKKSYFSASHEDS
jgi:hypothetical protein